MLDVRSDVPIYEVDGEEDRNARPLGVRSHWNDDDWVVLEVEGTPPVTVNGSALKKAIDNAMNSGRF